MSKIVVELVKCAVLFVQYGFPNVSRTQNTQFSEIHNNYILILFWVILVLRPIMNPPSVRVLKRSDDIISVFPTFEM